MTGLLLALIFASTVLANPISEISEENSDKLSKRVALWNYDASVSLEDRRQLDNAFDDLRQQLAPAAVTASTDLADISAAYGHYFPADPAVEHRIRALFQHIATGTPPWNTVTIKRAAAGTYLAEADTVAETQSRCTITV